MSEPLEPSAPDPAADEAPRGAPEPAFSPPALSAFDQASRTVLAGAAVAIVAALIGVVLGAWDFQPFALVIIVLGLVGAGAAYSLQAMDVGAQVKPWRPALLQVAGAVQVTATATPNVSAEALGVNAGALAVGASLATAFANPDVSAYVGASSQITAAASTNTV